MRSIIRQFIGHTVRWRPFAQTHYSQEGEDVLLQRLFTGQDRGFYVDVGAHHPQRLSNTYWAYRRGWRGINIDATPGSSRAFRKFRPRDITLEVCVAEEEGHVDFYKFPEAALNTSGRGRKDFVQDQVSMQSQMVKVRTEPLSKILDENLPSDVEVIDLMSIDIEGSEMDALRSNDWVRFKPRVLIIEILGHTLETMEKAEEVAYLKSLGFTPAAMMYHSAFFISDHKLVREWTLSHMDAYNG